MLACARARVAIRIGSLRGLMFFLVGVPGSNLDRWILLLHRSSAPVLVWFPLLKMADAAQLPRRGERRAAARAQNEEEGRRVRQRLDDVEVRLDGMQTRIDQHEMRLGFVEAHIKACASWIRCSA